MGRRINTLGYQATGGKVDGYFDKIIKYIPSDIVAAWTAAIGIITGGDTTTTTDNNTPLLIAFVVALALTAAWTWYQTKAPNQPPAIRQIIAATGSFAVWAFALPVGPANALGLDTKYGSLFLIVWTILLGFIPPDPSNPPPAPPAATG